MLLLYSASLEVLDGYPGWLLEGVDTPPPNQPVEGVEENPLYPITGSGRAKRLHRDQWIQAPWPGQNQEEISSCDSIRERNIRAGEKSDEWIQVEHVLSAHQYT